MMIKLTKIFVLLVSLQCIMAGCKDPWNDHSELNEPLLGKNLLEVIGKDPDLSRFKELLARTGYDKTLASSYKFTIWAPQNSALEQLDESVLNDTARLKQFVGNYIVSQPYSTKISDTVTLRLKTLNGKYVKFGAKKLEGIALVRQDLFAGNGILHVLNGIVYPKQNILEYMNNTSFKQKDYIKSLEYDAIDSARAEQIGVDPVTSKPIYKPGTGIIKKNYLFDKTGGLADEGQEYTVILLQDDAIDAELAKFQPYTGGDHPLVDNAYTVLKDLVFRKAIDIDTLKSAELISDDGVRVPFRKDAVLEKIKTSNGFIYRMSSAPVALADKIMPVRREGETPDGFSRTDKAGNIALRLRRAPLSEGAYLYNDIYVFNHKVPLFHVKYNFHKVYKGKYKIYWVAPNDSQEQAFKQRIAFNNFNGDYLEKTVPLKDYSEVEVGEYTVDKYGDLTVYIIADNNGTDGINSINLDYFKLVPVLP